MEASKDKEIVVWRKPRQLYDHSLIRLYTALYGLPRCLCCKKVSIRARVYKTAVMCLNCALTRETVGVCFHKESKSIITLFEQWKDYEHIMAKNDKFAARERKVFEVRTTTYIPEISSEKFVFEKHGDEWHAHFAEATHYSLEQLQQIVEVMKGMPSDGREIQ